MSRTHDGRPDFWDVSTWATPEARLPVESHRFSDKEEANTYARQQRARIAAKGWTHRVTVSPGMVQS